MDWRQLLNPRERSEIDYCERHPCRIPLSNRIIAKMAFIIDVLETLTPLPDEIIAEMRKYLDRM